MKNDLTNQLSQVAECFTGTLQCDSDIVFANKLDRKKLDFSTDSLHYVDTWLDYLFKKHITSETDGIAESIIWAGAYVGEVIIRNAQEEYFWLSYEDYMKTQDPGIRDFISYTFGTQFILSTPSGKMTLPVNKIIRWLHEGPENNLHFYVQAEIAQRK